MASNDKPDEPSPPLPEEFKVFQIQEVKYSLPLMLRELELERSHSFFAKEIIDQVEINKLFGQAKKARAKRKQ